MIRVFLAGEGPSELGSSANAPWPSETPGFIELTARRIRPDGWVVAEARTWRSFKKYQAGRAKGDGRNLAAALLAAEEAGARVALLLRDTDGDLRRRADLADVPLPDWVAFGTPHRNLEAWLVALEGRSGTEAMGTSKLPKRENLDAVANVIAAADLDHLPRDAETLRDWLSRVRTAFSAEEGDPPNAPPHGIG